MKLNPASHTDHVSPAILSYVMERFGDHQAFFLVTIELPPELGTVPCGLYGPMMGDDPVLDSEVELRARGDRAWPSRLVQRPTRETRALTVIGGPHDGEPCVLYTVFGGPKAPREPGDIQSLIDRAIVGGGEGTIAVDSMRRDLAEAEAFWAEHALSA